MQFWSTGDVCAHQTRITENYTFPLHENTKCRNFEYPNHKTSELLMNRITNVAVPNSPTTKMRNIRKVNTWIVAIPNNPKNETTFSRNIQHLKTVCSIMGTCISGKSASKEIDNYETEIIDCTTMVDGAVVTNIMRTHSDMLKPTLGFDFPSHGSIFLT